MDGRLYALLRYSVDPCGGSIIVARVVVGAVGGDGVWVSYIVGGAIGVAVGSRRGRGIGRCGGWS